MNHESGTPAPADIASWYDGAHVVRGVPDVELEIAHVAHQSVRSNDRQLTVAVAAVASAIGGRLSDLAAARAGPGFPPRISPLSFTDRAEPHTS